MARNSEKAQMTLNRLLQSKKDAAAGPRQKRPYLATECKDLNEADKWRQQILREVGKKVMEIQNVGLGESKIRDLNDEINKLIREKGHWEKRIVELGGPNYAATSKVTDAQGDEVKDATGRGAGYRYFGAAKSLPGVKELFERAPAPKVRRTRHQIFQNINADYYGFRDEEDGVLLRVEGGAETAMRAEAVSLWAEQRREREAAAAGAASGPGALWGGEAGAAGAEFVAYVPLPDVRDIEERVLEKKKRDLLAKYVSEDLLAQQETARMLREGE